MHVGVAITLRTVAAAAGPLARLASGEAFELPDARFLTLCEALLDIDCFAEKDAQIGRGAAFQAAL